MSCTSSGVREKAGLDATACRYKEISVESEIKTTCCRKPTESETTHLSKKKPDPKIKKRTKAQSNMSN
jgi:hypothetical protein